MNLGKWLLDLPMYKEQRMTDEVFLEIEKVMKNDVISMSGLHLDAFCQECNDSSVFKSLFISTNKDMAYRNASLLQFYKNEENTTFLFTFSCSRNVHHQIKIMLDIKGAAKYDVLTIGRNVFDDKFEEVFAGQSKLIKKIGQYPTGTDIEKTDNDKFASIIGKDKLSELKNASICKTFGMGAASFTYYRRVFEFVIDLEYESHKEDVVLLKNKEGEMLDWEHHKTSDKIDLLEKYLPQFVLDSKGVLYSILSSGVHNNLSDEKCVDYSDLLKYCINQILIETYKNREAEKEKEEALKALKNIKKNI
ncbi:MAG TPA: hypothetical protein PKG52_06410 [bacterium]|nr:hypothetical protein [bacterium]HPS30695.1 hypothetical protein [bacterium]